MPDRRKPVSTSNCLSGCLPPFSPLVPNYDCWKSTTTKQTQLLLSPPVAAHFLLKKKREKCKASGRNFSLELNVPWEEKEKARPRIKEGK